jgi:spore coat polysaccharide biosynthesis protein SpsF
MKTVAIVQARMGSTRLSGKVMRVLCGKTVLEHDIERIRQSKYIDEIIIATTISKNDDIIEKESLRCGTNCFRGSEEDVLNRYYLAAKEKGADIVVRITSDCPLFDPKVLDEMLEFYNSHNYKVLTNAGIGTSQRTYPRGLDTEIFTYEALEQAYQNATEKYQKEHVTPYIYENIKEIYYYKNPIDYSKYRWTLDTEEDWKLIQSIYEYLYHGAHDFYLDKIIELMLEYPELYNINKDVEQKKIKT